MMHVLMSLTVYVQFTCVCTEVCFEMGALSVSLMAAWVFTTVYRGFPLHHPSPNALPLQACRGHCGVWHHGLCGQIVVGWLPVDVVHLLLVESGVRVVLDEVIVMVWRKDQCVHGDPRRLDKFGVGEGYQRCRLRVVSKIPRLHLPHAGSLIFSVHVISNRETTKLMGVFWL